MGKITVYMKRVIITICTVVFIVSTTSCDLLKTDQKSKANLSGTGTDDLKQTAFEKDILFLKEKGMQLPDLSPDSGMMSETFLSLLVETYESLGDVIDISKVSPGKESSDALNKMTLIGVYENYFMEDDTWNSDLTYGTVAYWLIKLQDSIQNRLYWRSDATATIGDLLRRINVSNALHTWVQDATEASAYTVGDLLEGEAAPEQRLTRLIAAEMMVTAFEDISGELPISETPKLNDTDNINARKSNQFFFWPETGDFEPEKTGNWDDWSFISAVIYDSQLRLSLKLEESKAPYGAVVAAMASIIRSYDGLERNVIEEKIVLNERPYDWHVNQQESGEYSAVNCMPSTVEMSMRYQGLADVPSAEELREDNPSNGLGWHDVTSENVMRQYGLKFTDSFDVKLDSMIEFLDKGNVLYVMYREPNNPEGHSVIIKGYWKLGNSVNFIISDPNYNMLGPFGYVEYTKDAKTMISDIESHVPRYFIIPMGE